MTELNWGLIGSGDIARKRVVPALKDLEDCKLIAVARANAGLAKSFAAEFQIPAWYDSWETLLKDPKINAVYIATPVYLHAPMTISAAQAGKHILCEKPMALNMKECDAMIGACVKNKVELGIAYYRHFYPAVDKVKEIIAGGEIGEVVHININAFEYFNPDPSEPRSWLLEKSKSGGGPMFDFGCHRIEVLLNILGKAKNARGYLNKIFFEREVEDTATAVFEFESGTTAVLNVSHAAYEPQDTLDIFGSRGSIRIPVLNEGNMVIRTSKGEREIQCPPHKNFHQPIIEDFAEAVINGRPPIVSGNEGREVNRMLSLIYGDDNNSNHNK